MRDFSASNPRAPTAMTKARAIRGAGALEISSMR